MVTLSTNRDLRLHKSSGDPHITAVSCPWYRTLSQQVSIERFLSRTIVLQASAGGLKYNIIQISFIARDGSLIVSFPYGKHSSGLLSIGNIPAGQATSQVSLEPQGKCTSHKVKYTHHLDGRAHFLPRR